MFSFDNGRHLRGRESISIPRGQFERYAADYWTTSARTVFSIWLVAAMKNV